MRIGKNWKHRFRSTKPNWICSRRGPNGPPPPADSGYEELAEADKQLEQAKAKFKELKGAGGGALDEIKTGVKKALADLKVSTKKAAQHFNTQAPHRRQTAARQTCEAQTKPAKSRKISRDANQSVFASLHKIRAGGATCASFPHHHRRISQIRL